MPLAPPVGVVIANHSNCARVEKTIEPMVRQTGCEQVIVVDNAATDMFTRPGDVRFRYVKLGR